jgi:hypothetical protein
MNEENDKNSRIWVCRKGVVNSCNSFPIAIGIKLVLSSIKIYLWKIQIHTAEESL